MSPFEVLSLFLWELITYLGPDQSYQISVLDTGLSSDAAQVFCKYFVKWVIQIQRLSGPNPHFSSDMKSYYSP